MIRQIITDRDLKKLQSDIKYKYYKSKKGTLKFEEIPKTGSPPEVDNYFGRLIKYIPAEVIAFYTTLNGLIKSLTDIPNNTQILFMWIAFGLGLISTPLYLIRIWRVKRYSQIFISTISYAIWVFSIGSVFSLYTWYRGYYGSILLVVVTFFIPMITEKDDKKSDK